MRFVSFLAFCLSISASVSSASTTNFTASFQQFQQQFGKQYQETEWEHRLAIFTQNMQTIFSHNAGNHSFQMNVNQFSDLTPEEFKASYIQGFRRKREN